MSTDTIYEIAFSALAIVIYFVLRVGIKQIKTLSKGDKKSLLSTPMRKKHHMAQ